MSKGNLFKFYLDIPHVECMCQLKVLTVTLIDK